MAAIRPPCRARSPCGRLHASNPVAVAVAEEAPKQKLQRKFHTGPGTPRQPLGFLRSYPSLEKLGEGDLIHTVDFRAVYAALLDGWLGCSAERLLGGKFAPLPLLAT